MLEAEHRVAAVEDAEHDRLAVDHGDDRHAQVDLAAGDAEADAAVLGDALFGDVQVAEDLQARHDRRVVLADLRRDVRLDEDAVDAVADAKLVLERLDVDVGRAAPPAPRPMIWLTNLMIDASCAALVRSRSFSFASSRTLTPSSSSRPIDWSVSAPTPRYFLMNRSISLDGRNGRVDVDAAGEP